MNVGLDGTLGGDPADSARAGVLGRVRRWLAGPGAHRWTPQALMAMLASGVCAPLVLSGQADPGLAVWVATTAASVGGNVLTDVLTEGVERLKDRSDEIGLEELQDWLEGRFTQVLEAGGRQAVLLDVEIAVLLDYVDAGKVAIAEAIQQGHEHTARQMQTALDGQAIAVRSQLENLHITAGQAAALDD